MSEKDEKLVKDVINAWVVQGPAPWVHDGAIRKLHKEWPTLAKAVEKLSREYRGTKK